MKVCDIRTFGGIFVFLVAGVAAQMVNLTLPVCAVKGSTVTLPCSFRPGRLKVLDGREILHQVVRVAWCKNHLICQGETPTVYDSESEKNNPRFLYLGDKRTNCTLQIRDVRKDDNATFRFRMETIETSGHFTNKTGVKVSVVDETELRIRSSSEDGVRSEGHDVTLLCTSRCTIHQMNITWFRDGHTLSETGPALQLSSLTAGDSGNYTCGLKTTHSPPFSLRMDTVVTGSDWSILTAVHLSMLSVHTVLIIIVVASVVIRRSCDCRKSAAPQQTQA